MPGLDPGLVTHQLSVNPSCKPHRQPKRKFALALELQIKQEVQKWMKAGFITPVMYPEWLANIVPVKKKNGQIRICVDFRDLNKACPKDDFLVPCMDLLIDHTAGCESFSFMDGYSGYNQIRMHHSDIDKTAFYTPFGTYACRVMPFGLKNA